MQKVKLKARPKCHCDEHYLELCISFDGENFVYKRFCYKCGKSWTYTECFADKRSNASDSYITDSRVGISYICDTTGCRLSVPRTEITENTIMFDDGCQYCYVYKLNKDGTCGDLIKLMRYY